MTSQNINLSAALQKRESINTAIELTKKEIENCKKLINKLENCHYSAGDLFNKKLCGLFMQTPKPRPLIFRIGDYLAGKTYYQFVEVPMSVTDGFIEVLNSQIKDKEQHLIKLINENTSEIPE